jgi:hypothetical protein
MTESKKSTKKTGAASSGFRRGFLQGPLPKDTGKASSPSDSSHETKVPVASKTLMKREESRPKAASGGFRRGFLQGPLPKDTGKTSSRSDLSHKKKVPVVSNAQMEVEELRPTTISSGFRRGFLQGPKDTEKTSSRSDPLNKKKVRAASNALIELEESSPKTDRSFLVLEHESAESGAVDTISTGDVRASSFQLLGKNNDKDGDNIGLSEVSTTQRRPLIMEMSEPEALSCSNSNTQKSLEERRQPMPNAGPLLEEIDTSPLRIMVEDSPPDALPEDQEGSLREGATAFGILNQELSRALWRLRHNKGSKQVRWRSTADAFARGGYLSTERHWSIVWESLLDSISQSAQAKTAELRLGVALAEHRLESLRPFLRPGDDKESRMRTMGALLLIDYWLVSSSMDPKYLSSLLDNIPTLADIALGGSRKQTVLAQRSFETVLEIVASACDTVCKSPLEQTDLLARSVWMNAPIVNQIWTLQQTWIRGSPSLDQEGLSPTVPNHSLDARHQCRLAVLSDWNRVFVQCQELYDQVNSQESVAKEQLDVRLGRVWSGQLSGLSLDVPQSPIGSLRQTLCGSSRPRLTADEIVSHLERELACRRGNESQAKESYAEWGGLRRFIFRGAAAWLGEKKANSCIMSQCLNTEAKLALKSLYSETREMDCLALVLL